MPWQSARKDPAYGQAAWKRARLACLQRARWICERQIPGVCTGVATQANHRKGLAADPQHLDLEAICGPCHKQVTAGQSAAARKRRGEPAFVPRTRW